MDRDEPDDDRMLGDSPLFSAIIVIVGLVAVFIFITILWMAG